MMRVGVGECLGRGRDGIGVRAVADGEAQVVLATSAALVGSSSTESASTVAPTSVSLSLARWNAVSCALRYGHHEPR